MLRNWNVRVGNSVLSFRQRYILLERRKRLRRLKNVSSVDSVRKKVRQVSRYYLYNYNAVAIAIHYSLPVSSGFHIHTHAFRSLLRVVYALPTVHDTSTRKCRLPHHGYNAVADDSWVGSHLVPRITHWLLTEKVEKGQILWAHT